MLDTLPDTHPRAWLNAAVVVIGLGNRYRRDDGVGVAAATALRELALSGVRVVTDLADPMSLLEAWSGAGLAVLIDAAVATPATPGRVRRCALGDLAAGSSGVSSHRADVAKAYALGQALDRVPERLVIITVDVADIGHGVGLTPQVLDAIPVVVGLAVDEIGRPRPRAEV